MTNEITNVNKETGEILPLEVIRETENYTIKKDENGKFVRKAKYNDYSSIQTASRKEKMWLLNLLEGAEDTGNGLKESIGEVIEIQNIITRKYDRINEDTGETEYGVLTYLLDPDQIAYVTSSKNVYFSIIRIMELFGKPDDDDWENITIKVGSEKGKNGTMIKIKMIG